jgi:N-acetylneuraminic acid mutarotase
VGGDLVIAGGWTGKEPVLQCYRLRPGPDSRWERLPELPGPRVFPAAAVIGSTLYAIAGARDFDMTGGPRTDGLRLDLRRPEQGWRPVAPLPGVGRTASAAACDGRIYLFGGYADPKKEPPALAEALAYDPSTDRWTRLPDLPGTLYAASGASPDGRRVYLIGGVDTDQRRPPSEPQKYPFSARTLVYDTRARTYRAGTPLPRPNAADRALTDGRRLYILGGEVGFHVRSPWTFVGDLLSGE